MKILEVKNVNGKIFYGCVFYSFLFTKFILVFYLLLVFHILLCNHRKNKNITKNNKQ